MCIQQPTPRVTAARSAIGRASGFQLTSPSQPGAANIAPALSATAHSPPPAATRVPSSSPTCACS
jgi:hypothetical protein